MTAYVLYVYEFGELNLIHQYFTQPNPVNNLWFSFKKNYAATYCHGTTDSKVFHVIIKKSDFPYSVIEWHWLVSNLLLLAKMLDDNKRSGIAYME